MTPAPYNTLPGDPLPAARTFWLRADDDVRLRAAHWVADQAKGSVLIFPGRTEYVEKYAEVAADLNGVGFDVMTLDWRGQGMSDRLLADPRPGHVAAFADYQRDVIELIVAAEELGLPRPWHLLSHSMGGAIALAALHDGLQVNSTVFSAPMWGLQLSPMLRLAARLNVAVAEVLGLGHRAAIGSGGYDPLVLKNGFLNNLLTNDGIRWGRFIAEAAAWPDLCIGGVSNHWLGAAMAECTRLADLPALPLPTLVGVGGDEAIIDPAAIRTRIAAWPGAKLIELPGCRHELLMERDADRANFLAAMIGLFQNAN